MLEQYLLSLGGKSILGDQLQYDPDCDTIRAKGKIFTGQKAFIPMKANACHWNISELFQQGLIDSIVIGYALSNEDIWFQHTWGLLKDILVETSEINFLNVKTYFGVVLEEPNSFVKLCKENPQGRGKVRRDKPDSS